MPEMSEYVKTFKTFKVKDGDKDKNNKLTSFRIDEKLLGKYKIIWTNIEGLKNIDFFKKKKKNWDSLCARLNSHYEPWSYKKRRV